MVSYKLFKYSIYNMFEYSIKTNIYFFYEILTVIKS